MVVEILFAHEAVLADAEAVIGGIDDDGVVAQAAGVEGLEDASDLHIHVGDHGVIVGDVALDFGFGSRVGGEEFVADMADAGIEGVFGQEVGWQDDGGGIVHGVVGWGRGARIVGRGEGDVGEEGIIVRRARVQEVDHFV